MEIDEFEVGEMFENTGRIVHKVTGNNQTTFLVKFRIFNSIKTYKYNVYQLDKSDTQPSFVAGSLSQPIYLYTLRAIKNNDLKGKAFLNSLMSIKRLVESEDEYALEFAKAIRGSKEIIRRKTGPELAKHTLNFYENIESMIENLAVHECCECSDDCCC